MMEKIFDFDAYTPANIAKRIDSAGVTKAQLHFLPLFMLAMLAGAFISLGAIYFVVIKSDAATLGFALSQTLGGLVFSLGLILVVIAGAELFTGNNLLSIAWADGKVTTLQVLRNWVIVCIGNCIGAVMIAFLVIMSGHLDMNQGLIGKTYHQIAVSKAELPAMQAFFRGILCNILVCLAIWMAFAGHSVSDKILAIIFPISAFVACGFEHSVANMFFFSVAFLNEWLTHTGVLEQNISLMLSIKKLGIVIIGNIIGGSILVGLVYHLIYQRAH